MSLLESIAHREAEIISHLMSRQTGIDDATGKGSATESYVEAQLLRPSFPVGFDCIKGAIVCADAPHIQSPAIDRVIYDRGVGAPLVADPAHSIFPLEVVCGAVEITMRLDPRKLRQDMERLAKVRQMRTRRYLAPAPGTQAKVTPVQTQTLGIRSFAIGLPSDAHWPADRIAAFLTETQRDLSPWIHMHGVYVLGIGFFETLAVEAGQPQPYYVRAWTGPDRLFRFSNGLRAALATWPREAHGVVPDLNPYIPGAMDIYELAGPAALPLTEKR